MKEKLKDNRLYTRRYNKTRYFKASIFRTIIIYNIASICNIKRQKI